MNLNDISACKKPVTASKYSEYVGPSGVGSITVTIPRIGYTAGECIPVSAEIENVSHESIKKTTE